MQTTKLMALTLIAALAGSGTVLLAGEGKGRPAERGGRHQWQARSGERMGPGGRPVGRLMQILDDEQREKARDILESAREEAQDAETRRERREIMAEAHKKVMGLLTDEQKARLEKARPRRGPQLDITDEQKAKAKKIWTSAREQAKTAASRVERVEIYKKAQSDLQALLTDQQKAKLEGLRKNRGPGIELTEQQKAEIAEIRKVLRTAMVFAETPDARRQLLKQAREDIKAVLTAEQLKKLEAFRKKHAKRSGRGRRRGGRGMMMGGRDGMGRRGRGGTGGWLDRQLAEPKGELLPELK